MKKTTCFLLGFCLMLPILTGCGIPKPTAVDSVKAIYELYIQRNTEGARKLGLTEAEISNALSLYDHALSNTIRQNFSASGLEINSETIDTICQARIEAFSKMTATYTLVSEKDGTAVVTLDTTYFDEAALDTNAAYDAREAADEAGFTDYEEYLKFIMETYTNNLIESYQKVTPSQDTKQISVTCSIFNNTWLPSDMAAFGGALGRAVAGLD